MPPYDPKRHHRRSIRLKGYDYTQPGAYFVTVVVHQRETLLGEISAGILHSNRLGEIVSQAWLDLPRHYPYVVLDAYICMPNHIHGIMVLRDDTRRGGSVPGRLSTLSGTYSDKTRLPENAQTRPYEATRHGVPEIIRAFKSFSARRINILRRTPGTPVWQRNYYEHVIRNELEMKAIRRYIQNNPAQWELDQENVED